MDTRTNELLSPEALRSRFGDNPTDEQLREVGLTPVPKKLSMAARRALHNKWKVTISRNSGGKLSNWAKKQRRKNKVH